MESMELLELCIRWESRSPRCEVSAFWVVDGRFLSRENQKGGGVVILKKTWKNTVNVG